MNRPYSTNRHSVSALRHNGMGVETDVTSRPVVRCSPVTSTESTLACRTDACNLLSKKVVFESVPSSLRRPDWCELIEGDLTMVV